MKRIISLVLALSMVLSICATAFAATSYPDLVGENAKYAAAVDALTELKVINGFPDGEFKPNNELTRAELAKMLVICLGLGDQVAALSARTVFSDVATTHWAAGYINAAAQSKVINGYPDGEFKPEKNVTYAEAFTMCLRALGYGNVVDAEGTWPTAYMLKAVELELTDDMENVVASANATRGNTAILLWNMLRTPMWRIESENETNGMNLKNTGDLMLEVKFPNYTYLKTYTFVDDIYHREYKYTLDAVDVSDAEDVRVTVGDITGKIKDVDLNKLVIGMEIEALVKNYKDEDKATFLTLTPVNTIVSGFVTDLNVNFNTFAITFKVNGTEYKLDEEYLDDEDIEDILEFWDQDTYVVLEAKGKKAIHVDTLPVEGKYADAQSIIDSMINEDDLVIIDGKWAKDEDVKVGSIITEVDRESVEFDGVYYMVSTETKSATFDVAFYEKEDWLGEKLPVEYISLDDKESRIVDNADDAFTAWKDEKNNKRVYLDDLTVPYKDNEYSDTKVEVFYNYLGIVTRVHFGDVEKNSSNAGFYAVTSNGAWGEGSNKGRILNIDLVGQDGKENEYKSIVSPTISNDDGRIDGNEDIYKNDEPTFVWVAFDDNDEKMETIVVLDDEVPAYNSDDGAKKYDEDNPNYKGYRSKFAIVDAGGIRIDGKKLFRGEIELDERLGGTTYFYELIAEKNDKDKVVGYDAEITSDRTEYDGYTLPTGSLMAVHYDENSDTAKVRYVFIPGEANSNMHWGKLESINTSRETVKISGSEATKLGVEDGETREKDVEENDIVGFRESKDGKTARIFDFVRIGVAKDYEDDTIQEVIGSGDLELIGFVNGDADVDDDDDYIPLVGGGRFDTEGSDYKDEKKVPVYKVSLSYDKRKDTYKVSSVEKVGEGRPAVQENANSWDRIYVGPKGSKATDPESNIIPEVYFIFTGIFDKNNTPVPNNGGNNGGNNAQPSGGNNAQPASGDNVQPASGDNAQPASGDNAQPASGDNAQPASGDNAQP